MNTAIKSYLTNLGDDVLTEEQAHRDTALLTVINDLNAIGDVIADRFISLAHRQLRGKTRFTRQGWDDLLSYHQQIEEALQQVLAALATHDSMLATVFQNREHDLEQIKLRLHQRHIRQLRDAIPDSATSSDIYLGLLDAMSVILTHTSKWAKRLRLRHIGDFTGWQDETTYRQALAILLKHLKVEKTLTV